MKTVFSILALIALLALPSQAQTPPVINNGTVTFGGVTLKVPDILGQQVTIQGQTLLVVTNQSGGYNISTWGAAGSLTNTPPQTMADAFALAKDYVQENNPANVGYYPTNGEWNFSVAGVFAQNSGQAAAQISVEHYFNQNWGLGAAVLEGNQNGQNGTAAAYAYGYYRKPIGDTALIGSLGGGYDNYTSKPMGIVKIEVEHRQSAHLSEFVGVGYDFEGFGKTKTQANTTISDPSGIIVGGGVRYSFSSINPFAK
jgi:hypothetical protein